MAVIQVAVVDENGNPRRGVTVAAYDLDNFPAIQTTGVTSKAGVATLTITKPAFVDAFDRRGVSFRDRSYEGKIQIQFVSMGQFVNVDYVVDSNGFGTHTTLYGTGGAFADAVADAASRVIWVCTTHEETVTASTALATLTTNQVITVMSGSAERAQIQVSFSGKLFTQSASQPSGARMRFENIGFRATGGNTVDFFGPTAGAATVPFDVIGVRFDTITGGIWRYFVDFTGSGSATSSGILLDRVRGNMTAIANLSSGAAATGPVMMENCEMTLTHIFNRTNSTDFEAGSAYLIKNNTLIISGYAMQQTYFGPSCETVITGNHIIASLASTDDGGGGASGNDVLFMFGTGATSGTADIAFGNNFIEVTRAAAGVRAIRVGTAGVTTTAANVSIAGNSLRGPGSLATAIEFVAGLTATGCFVANGYRDWATNFSGSTGGTSGGLDHGSLGGLADDDHTQYFLLAGRSGGQVAIGGTASGNDLTLQSTSNATRGSIFFGSAATSVYDEVNDTWGFGRNDTTGVTVSGSAAGIRLTIHQLDLSYAATFERHNASGLLSPDVAFVRSRGSAGSETIVVSGDTLGRISFLGHDSVDYELAASISAQVDTTPGSGDMPGRLVFSTTADGSVSPTERLRLVSTGGAYFSNHLRVGSVSAPTNLTDGDITGIRLSIGNSAALGSAGNVGHFADIAGSMTNTAAGAAAFFTAQPTYAPTSASSTEFRTFYLFGVTSDSGGTFNLMRGVMAETRHRSTQTIAEVIGGVFQAFALDSSSPATPGTVALAVGVEPRVYGRATGTSTVSVTDAVGVHFRSGRLIAGAGGTFTNLYNIKIEDQSTNTITTFYGLHMAKLTRGSTNINFLNEGKMVYTPTSQTLAAATNTIGSTARLQDVDNSTGASLTLTSTPTITAGVSDGQLLTITNVDSADNIVIQDETALAGSALRLPGAANLTLGPRDSVTLRWRASASEWWAIATANL